MESYIEERITRLRDVFEHYSGITQANYHSLGVNDSGIPKWSFDGYSLDYRPLGVHYRGIFNLSRVVADVDLNPYRLTLSVNAGSGKTELKYAYPGFNAELAYQWEAQDRMPSLTSSLRFAPALIQKWAPYLLRRAAKPECYLSYTLSLSQDESGTYWAAASGMAEHVNWYSPQYSSSAVSSFLVIDDIVNEFRASLKYPV